MKTLLAVLAVFAGSLLGGYLAWQIGQRRNDRLLNDAQGCLVAPAFLLATGVGVFCLFAGLAVMSNPLVVEATDQAAETNWWATVAMVAMAGFGAFCVYWYFRMTLRMDRSGIRARSWAGWWRRVAWTDVASLEYDRGCFVVKGSPGMVIKVPADIEGLPRFAVVALDKVSAGQIEDEARKRLESEAYPLVADSEDTQADNGDKA